MNIPTLEGEVWKSVPGFNDKIYASTLGRIWRKGYITRCGKNYNRKLVVPDKILRPNTHGRYAFVEININGERKSFFVHRLIAITFLQHLDDKTDINHKDGNKLNNCVENLEWVTKSENIQHAINVIKTIKTGSNNALSKLSDDEVKWIRQNYKPGDLEFGMNALCQKFKMHRSQMSRILKNKYYYDSGYNPVSQKTTCPTGECGYAAKLTQEQADQIRSDYNNNHASRKSLSQLYNVSLSTIDNIINNKTYTSN